MAAEDKQRWDARFETGDYPSGDPTPFLVHVAAQLPATGSALDVAGGAGRNGCFLASRGLDVTVADISDRGLELASQRASELGVSVATLAIDLERQPIPRGPWDLIVVVGFLQRQLFPAYREALAAGGLLVAVIATTTNLERHRRPPRRFLVTPGELRELVLPLEIVEYVEDWTTTGRHTASVLARKPDA